MFTDASSEMIYPLLPIFITGLVPTAAAAAVYLGLMEGVAESTASLLKIVSGRISDSLGARKILVVAGYGFSTVCRPLMGLATAGWHVVGLRFLDRVGKGIRTSPRDALISDSVDPAGRGLAFSFHRAMDHLGAVIGPLVSILILWYLLGRVFWASSAETASPVEMHALRILFWISLIPGLAAMAALVWKVREIKPQRAAAPDAQTGAKADSAKSAKPDTSGAKPDAAVNKAPLPKKFYYFVSIVTLFTLGNSSDLFLVFYGKTLFNLGLFEVILLWVGLHIFKIIFSLPGGALSDRLGRRPMIVAGWAVYTVVYLGMAFVSAQWAFWALFFIYGAYYGFSEGAEKALVADYVPSANRGRAYGIYHGAIGLAALPASLMFGLFWQALGPHLAFGIGAALAGVATALLMVLLATGGGKKEEKQSAG
ncbi:MAG: MFS transporter [Candidatus Sumerlaeota bacterium]|nr:MFS transporter [Candidatus Sumerlaeota bacterium]